MVLAIVGMPGSGKSEVASLLKEKNFPIIRFGDETDRGLQEQGLPPTEENERIYRENLRQTYGMEIYAVKALPKIHDALTKNNAVVLDGLYSWEEYRYLQKQFPQLEVIAIVAKPQVRYKRLSGRSHRPLSEAEGRQRDIDEIEKLNKGGPIAIADYIIENNGTTGELKEKIEALLQQLHIS